MRRVVTGASGFIGSAVAAELIRSGHEVTGLARSAALPSGWRRWAPAPSPLRWPTVHRQDAARLYPLAAEKAPPGSVLHGVGEEGVPIRAIAERIASHLGVPAQPVPPEDADAHFGWLAELVATDAPASSTATRKLLDREPSSPSLLNGLDYGRFFDGAQSARRQGGRAARRNHTNGAMPAHPARSEAGTGTQPAGETSPDVEHKELPDVYAHDRRNRQRRGPGPQYRPGRPGQAPPRRDAKRTRP